MMNIAIASGKGGTGKTLVSTNLFYLLKQENFEVNLVDCDAEEPNCKMFISGEKLRSHEVTQQVPVIDTNKCTYCGRCFDYCNYNAIFFLKEQSYIKVLEDECHGCGACLYACEDGAITEKPDLLGEITHYKISNSANLFEARMKVGAHSPVPTIQQAIDMAMGVDVTLFDSPPGTSCPFVQTVNKADFVVLVTESTPFGLSDLKQSVDTLRTMNKACGVIVNRDGLGNNEVYEYLRSENIPLLMRIPFDKEIAKTYSIGELLVDKSVEWRDVFLQLFENIKEQYGNSNN